MILTLWIGHLHTPVIITAGRFDVLKSRNLVAKPHFSVWSDVQSVGDLTGHVTEVDVTSLFDTCCGDFLFMAVPSLGEKRGPFTDFIKILGVF